MPEAISTFLGGLDFDSSKTSDLSKKYRDAKNFRLITDDGGSSGSLENLLGNRLYFSLPDTSPVITFTATGADGGAAHGSEPVGIIINGVTYTDNSGTNSAAGNDALRDLFVELINDSTVFSPFNIVAVPTGLTSVMIYSTGTTVTTLDMDTVANGHISSVTQTVPIQTGLRVIGWTTIRDDFILMTCSRSNPVTGGPGQIWKLAYSPETVGTTYTTVLTLLYNNNINFTIQHPIPSPGAIVGRYENGNTQRIYWTDFFNRVRKFNTADPDGFGIPASNLALLPPTDLSKPILKEITIGGSLTTASYQFAYNLIDSAGRETLYSVLSNQIPIHTLDENDGNTGMGNYVGQAVGAATGKLIKAEIRGLDTDFDRIQIVRIRRRFKLGVPLIAIIIDEPIPSSGIYSFDYDGNEVATALTLEEFIIRSNFAFTHCKSLEQKDNILFVANVKNQRLDLDFDARAFRYDNTGVGPDNSTLSLTGDYVVGDSQDELDDINPDQDVYKYQSDGATIGGAGAINSETGLPNITYRILAGGLTPGTINLTGNRSFLQDSRRFGDSSGGTLVVPHRLPDRTSGFTKSLGITDQDYEQPNFYENYISPYYHGLFKGYVRGGDL